MEELKKGMEVQIVGVKNPDGKGVTVKVLAVLERKTERGTVTDVEIQLSDRTCTI